MSQRKDEVIDEIIQMLKSHYGDAAKSFWVYAEERCPGCQERNIDEFVFKGERTVSINGFMYREKSVLIAYFLCSECAKKVHAAPAFKQTPLHQAIEDCLKAAYQHYLSTLDA